MPAQTVKLQINPRHGIIRGLSAMIEKDEDTALLVSNQLMTMHWLPQICLMIHEK